MKKKILCWSDAVFSATGFSTVARNILQTLHSTGLYEIDQLAINYTGSFYDREQFPYNIVSAKLEDPTDPYGQQMFANTLLAKEYDIVLIINDPFVVQKIAEKIGDIRKTKQSVNHHDFDLVYYFPVDCRLWKGMSTMIEVADLAVPYTNFAVKKAKEIGLSVSEPIYHGTEIKNFYPLLKEERKALRRQWFHIEDDNTFLLINVNRNTIRKDISKTILAFSEFHKEVPNSVLYLHTAMVDSAAPGTMLDLKPCIFDLGLNPKKDIIFPTKFNPAKGFPVNILNQLYNAANAYITTSLGEGWGLNQVDAMCAGIPVIAPNNTSSPEIFGEKSERGYLYECKEQVYLESSGYRPVGRLEDIIGVLNNCYQDWKFQSREHLKKIQDARSWAMEHSWEDIGKQWIKLFSELKRHERRVQIYENQKVEQI